MPATEMTTADGPAVYQRLASAIGEAHWQGAVDRQEAAIRANPFLGDYLRSEYDIAYQLDSLRKSIARFGTRSHQPFNDPSVYPSLAFSAQVLEVLKRTTTPNQARTFVKRVRTAFAGADNMHGLRLEMLAATHFVSRGHSVLWHRPKNDGTFDLLVEDLGPNGLEVECKSISDDKGRRIHRLESLEFLGEMRATLDTISRNLRTGLAVVLTVPYRLPKHAADRAALADGVFAAIMAGSGATLNGGATVRIAPFDPAVLKAASRIGRQEWRKTIDAVTGTANRSAAIYLTPAGGMLAFVMQSAVEDDMLNQVFSTLDDSAERQFTRTRGGLFWVMLQGIESAELSSLHESESRAGEQPTPLRRSVSDFLHRAPEHIVGVVFASRSSLSPTIAGSTDSGGVTNFFLKEESRFWDPSFRNPLNVRGDAYQLPVAVC